MTKDELELAAQSSYAYWKASLEAVPSDEQRVNMAMREAKRYFVAASQNEAKALEFLRKTCTFRKSRRVDILRACFDKDHTFADNTERDLAAQFRERILQDTANQEVVVLGRDTEGCAVLRLGERTCVKMDDEAFLTTQLYMVERALATTEANTEGSQDSMVVLLDATCFKSKCAPSRSTLKELVSILQNHYPQRLKRLVVLNAPVWLRSAYAVLSPFLDKRTRRKFQVANGAQAKRRTFEELNGTEDAGASDQVDMRLFLARVPFQCGFECSEKAEEIPLSFHGKESTQFVIVQ